ncbi:hypothetical protein GMSM_00860 [Geomonas sp. Red276]
MKRVILTVLALSLLFLLTSCNRKQESASSNLPRVSATPDYLRSFGVAPTTEKGTCFAFVIYFPSAKPAGKVTPIPFFSFDEGKLQTVALQRLMMGMDSVPAYRGEFLQPFPPGTRLLGVGLRGTTVTVNFSKEIATVERDPRAAEALVTAVVLTLKQFEKVRQVRLTVDGSLDALDTLVGHADASAVMAPSAPRLLSVTAAKEKGAKNAEEINAYFDRPVEIKALRMAGADGKPFQGELFQSVFDMAGVLKPKDPALFVKGMPVEVHWEVADKLGRKASGDQEVPLEWMEH